MGVAMWGHSLRGAWGAVLLWAAAGWAVAAEVPPLAFEQRSFVVGFAQDNLANDYRAAQVRDAREALAHYPNIRFVVNDAQGDTARQILNIETLAAQPVDVLITSPPNAEAMTPVLSRVQRSGIPVILLSRGIRGDDYRVWIRMDNRAIGRQAAQYLAGRLNGQGRVLMLSGVPNSTVTQDRTQGFVEELKNHPGLTLAADLRTDFLRGKALQAMDEALAAGLAFDAIYAQSDSVAAAARMALHKAGIPPGSLPTVGIDYIREAREAIRAGEQDASFTYPTLGREGAEAAVAILRGEPLAREIQVTTQKVTRQNVEEVEPIF
jgi:ribose transport system substrate-binding protein